MAEGTRLSKIDEPIKGFTKFRKETEVQICALNKTLSKFMHVVDQRIIDVSNHSQHTYEENPINLPTFNNHHNNHQFRSMKIDVPHFDGTDVSSWIFKMEHFF